MRQVHDRTPGKQTTAAAAALPAIGNAKLTALLRASAAGPCRSLQGEGAPPQGSEHALAAVAAASADAMLTTPSVCQVPV